MKKETAASNDIAITTIQGVDCYESNGVAYLRLENVARGLGLTHVATSGNEVVRWDRVTKYLKDFGVVPTSGHGNVDLPDYIPENIFYRLAMKAKNATAEAFQAKVADEIIPAIRRTGKYEVNQSVSDAVEISGPFLRQLRERKGLTIVDVSKATGVNYYNLAGFERGKDKKFCVGRAKRVRVYNYLMSLPDATLPRVTSTPGRSYVTSVRNDLLPVERRDNPVNNVSVEQIPFTMEEFNELIKTAVTNALGKALCDAMTQIITEVQNRNRQ